MMIVQFFSTNSVGCLRYRSISGCRIVVVHIYFQKKLLLYNFATLNFKYHLKYCIKIKILNKKFQKCICFITILNYKTS